MVGSLGRVLLALAALAAVASSANALGGHWSYGPVCTTAYAPVPIWCWVPVTCVPAAMPAWGTPAIPRPAPPSAIPIPKASALTNPLPAFGPTGKEPPLRAPAITESRSFGGVMPAQRTEVAPGRCKVGFWNITGADVTLKIDGQPRQLPKDRAVTLELNRSFVWQISGREPQAERVPDAQNLFEVILRP